MKKGEQENFEGNVFLIKTFDQAGNPSLSLSLSLTKASLLLWVPT